MIKKFLPLLFLCLSLGFSQNPLLSKNAKVSIFTCGKGSELYSTFGHTAIRIQDSKNFLDVVYNYGAFDFRTENFYLKFVKGDLQYFINATSYEDFIFEYQLDNREVIEQTLDLNVSKKQELFEALNSSLYSEQKYYTYKFIDRNCTTMVMDKVNNLFDKKVLKKIDDTSISYREVLYPYFEDHFYYKLGINIIFGAPTDIKSEQLFLPIELLHSIDNAKINGKKLVLKKEIIVKGNKIEKPFSFINSIYFIALLLLIILVIHKRIVVFSYLFILGLFGLFLCLVGFYSLHKEILWNYNALLFNPLYLLLPFLKKEWFKRITIVSMIFLAIYCCILVTKPHLLLMLPFIACNSYILAKLHLRTQTSE